MISFLIPAYNEEDSIQETITTLRNVMDDTNWVYEIIIIDDGSEDLTYQAAEQCDVILLRNPINCGYGCALKNGVKNSSFDWCAIVDADGSYPIDSFPELLQYIPDFEMVVGARSGKHFYGSLAKRFGRKALLAITEYVTGRDIPDVNSGMRIFRRDIALKHINRISSGFSFTATITLAMSMEGHFIKYVPINYLPRVGKSKVNMPKDTLRMMQVLSRAILYYNPVKLFLPISLASLLWGAILMILLGLLGSWTIGIFFFAVSVLVALAIGSFGFLADMIRLIQNT